MINNIFSVKLTIPIFLIVTSCNFYQPLGWKLTCYWFAIVSCFWVVLFRIDLHNSDKSTACISYICTKTLWQLRLHLCILLAFLLFWSSLWLICVLSRIFILGFPSCASELLLFPSCLVYIWFYTDATLVSFSVFILKKCCLAVRIARVWLELHDNVQTITMERQSHLNSQCHHQQLSLVMSRLSVVLDLLAILWRPASIRHPMAKGREIAPMLKQPALPALTTRYQNVNNG